QVAGQVVAHPPPGELPVDAEGEVAGAEHECRVGRQVLQGQAAQVAGEGMFKLAHPAAGPQPVEGQVDSTGQVRTSSPAKARKGSTTSAAKSMRPHHWAKVSPGPRRPPR